MSLMIRLHAPHRLGAALAVSFIVAGAPARAEDLPVIKVEMRDGTIIPNVIEVPANTRFKLEITKLEGDAATGPKVSGMLMPMVANDGPHYGDNVKLSGPGRYRLKLTVAPPGANSHFGRHVDKETGVAEWFKPFDLIQDFTFAGIGKKGAY